MSGKKRTRLSPLSLAMFGGRPAGSACSKIGMSPCLAASYIRVANAMISGDSGVNWIVWSPMIFNWEASGDKMGGWMMQAESRKSEATPANFRLKYTEYKYGGLHRKSWTLKDCQGKISGNFGLWHDYLRFTMAVFQRIIALAWVCECVFGNSLGFCPIN